MEAANLLARPSYFRSLKKFSDSEIAEINNAIALLPEAMGKPHVHSGLGASANWARPCLKFVPVCNPVFFLPASQET